MAIQRWQDIQAIKDKAADALVKALGMEDCHVVFFFPNMGG